MPDPRMPDRNTPAANADILGEEARNGGQMEGLAEDLGQDGTPRERARPATGRGEAQPGKDINQAGFIKDQDKPGS